MNKKQILVLCTTIALMVVHCFELKAQLKFFNIWPIGDRNYVMDFNFNPPKIYKDSTTNLIFNGSNNNGPRNLFCNSKGELIFKTFDELVFNKNSDTIPVPKLKEAGYHCILPQMPSLSDFTYYMAYPFYYYFQRLPIGLASWWNFKIAPVKFIDSSIIDFNYRYDSNWDIAWISPYCDKHLLFMANSDGNLENGPFYMDILEIVNGKSLKRSTIDEHRNNVTFHCVSPNGKIVVIYNYKTGLEFHEFNHNTLDYNKIPFYTSGLMAYPTFSLNGRLLYFIRHDSLIQTSIEHLNKDSILKSEIPIAKLPNSHTYKDMSNGMLLTPNGEIYITFNFEKQISIIKNSNKKGKECNFVFNGFPVPFDSIQLNISSLQLPHFRYFASGSFYNPGLKVLPIGTICKNTPVKLQSDWYEDYITYSWKVNTLNGKELLTQDGSSVNYLPPDTGTFVTTLYYRWSCNLLDSSKDTFMVVPEPVKPQNIPDTLLCAGTEYNITSSENQQLVKISWYHNDKLIFVGKSFTTNSGGEFTVRYQYPCKIMYDTFKVNYIENPKKPINDAYVKCVDMAFLTLTPEIPAFSNVKWSTGSSMQSIQIKNPGTYSLHIKNKCYDTTWQFLVRAENPNYALFIPNSFTPDGDGLNDNFFISGLEELSDYECKIFNRWGEKVFETSNPNIFWDGKYNEVKVLEGAYVFYIKGRSTCSGDKKFRGIFYLIRNEK